MITNKMKVLLCFILTLYIAIKTSEAEAGQINRTNIADSVYNYDYFLRNNEDFDLKHAIPGEPGIEYPIYDTPPITNFNCDNRHEGYYADVETRCQVFRICTNTDQTGDGFGFLCPNGTIFNQKKFVCDWYKNVIDCNESEKYYNMNKILGKFIKNKDDMMKSIEEIIMYPIKNMMKIISTKNINKLINSNKYYNINDKDENNNNNNNLTKLLSINNNKRSSNYNNKNVFISNTGELSTDDNSTFDSKKSSYLINNENDDNLFKYYEKQQQNQKLSSSSSPAAFNKKINLSKRINNYFYTLDTMPLTDELLSTDQSIQFEIKYDFDNNNNNNNNLPKSVPSTYLGHLSVLKTNVKSITKAPSLNYENINNNNNNKNNNNNNKYKYNYNNENNHNQSVYNDNINYDRVLLLENPSITRLNEKINSNVPAHHHHQQQRQEYENYQRKHQLSGRHHSNLADNVNSVLQARMDEGTNQEFISTSSDNKQTSESLFLNDRRNLAGFINSAIIIPKTTTVNSEYRAGRQFQFQSNGFSKGGKRIITTTHSKFNAENNDNSRSYLPPPQNFKLPKTPDVSSLASGFKLNNQDSFSTIIPQNILDITKLFIGDSKSTLNQQQDKYNKTDKFIDKSDRINKSNSDTRTNNSKTDKTIKTNDKIKSLQHNEKQQQSHQQMQLQLQHKNIIKNSNYNLIKNENSTDNAKQKADNLLLNGFQQALYENDTKIHINDDNSLDTNDLVKSIESPTATTQSSLLLLSSSSAEINNDTNVKTTNITTTTTTPTMTTTTTTEKSNNFLTPTPIPVIELSRTEFPFSLFSTKAIKTTSRPTRTSHRRTVQKTSFPTISFEQHRNPFAFKTNVTRQTANQNNSTRTINITYNRGQTSTVTASAVPIITTTKSPFSITTSNYNFNNNNNGFGSKKLFSITTDPKSVRSITTKTATTTTTTRSSRTTLFRTTSSSSSSSSSSRRRQSIRQSLRSTTNYPLPKTTQSPSNDSDNNEDNDKTLTDLTPLANSYGFNRNNFNRIRNETYKKTSYRQSKTTTTKNSNNNNSNNNFLSRNFTIPSVTHRTSKTFSFTTNSTFSSRQSSTKFLSNNSTNETNLQATPINHSQKTTLSDRFNKNKELSVKQETKSLTLNKTQIQDNKKRPVYVDLPGTKVTIAKSEEHDHFTISNNPLFSVNNQQNPYAALSNFFSNGGKNDAIANQVKSLTTSTPKSQQQSVTNFFLPFPTISPPLPPTTLKPVAPINANKNDQFYQQLSSPTTQQLHQQQQNFQQQQLQKQYLNNLQQQLLQQYFQQQHQQQHQLSTEQPILLNNIQPTTSFYQNFLTKENNNNNNNNNNNKFSGFSLMPNNNFQFAQRRLDIVEDPIKEKSLYSGVSSYHVPLQSVGRLPTDVTDTQK